MAEASGRGEGKEKRGSRITMSYLQRQMKIVEDSNERKVGETQELQTVAGLPRGGLENLQASGRSLARGSVPPPACLGVR